MKSILDYFKIFLPTNKQEYYLFFIPFVAYLSLGIYFSIYSNIIYNDKIPWDIYASFDNSFTARTGGLVERHPLAYFFFNPVYRFLKFIFNNNNHAMSCVYVILCALTICSSNIITFKYLKNIIKLNNRISLLIYSFYVFFSTNILLSFTPENYTITLLLLTFYIYTSSLILKNKNKIPLSFVSIMTTLTGGITITNFPKIFIPLLFENKKLNSKAIKSIVGKALIATSIFLLISVMANFNTISTFYEKINSGYTRYSGEELGFLGYVIRVISYFFGGPILFPDFNLIDFSFSGIMDFKGLYFHFHYRVIHYIFFLIIFLFLVGSGVINKSNKYVRILILSFLVDVILHCVLKIGLSISFIYGGHWIFIVPMLIGWFFKTISVDQKKYKFYTIIFCITTTYLIVNNFYRMIEFIDFANTYHKAH